MCGIVGYVGARNCVPILLDGLRKLEYRGYDSAGIAILTEKGLEVRRAAGKLAMLEEAIRSAPISGTIGIGHTRWATHGPPNEENAHPHRAGGVVLVHNGIIENYLALRAELRSLGRRMASETDTEVMAHLIDIEMLKGQSLFEAVRTALRQVKGSYAIAVMTEREPGRLVVARMASPLIVAVGDGEAMVASDIPALLGFSRQMYVMEDGEVGVVEASSYEAFDLVSGQKVSKRPITINMTPAMAEKGGYKHFMLKEIFEQPRAIIDTLRGRIAPEKGEVYLDEVGPSEEILKNISRVHLAACGTSWHAALVGRYLITSLARLPVEVHLAGEFDAAIALPSNRDLFITISQSGETLDTLRTHREARKLGLITLAITNTVASSLAREADYCLYTHAGPEISVASTKAFTTQIVALYLLALALGKARGLLGREEVSMHLKDLLTLPGLVEEVLRRSEGVRAVAMRYSGVKNMLFLGRGILYPVALEGALKLKEISYVHGEGYSAGEMKHGPIALIDETFPVVILTPRTPMYSKTLMNLNEVKARNGKVIAVADEDDKEVAAQANDILPVPRCPLFLTPIVTTVPLQLFAYHVADIKGTDVDQPRNLAKSVTVE